ncbi:hypothetical protein BDA99DRAFT_502151 [Phascolomyces articulosus]|uniref:F-box domain-containing protein n=1 Tax=Phascolomyces articulosus TaxID=60185 RepID=A0AAD5K5M7_9FUNG|nr:hypothetical protein BDA99DRAFT_502151 [Phascolomyces articulosus]
MPDFTQIFPPELISDVLFFLNQKDCIECMSVCHRWFDLFPKYGMLLWNKLDVTPNSWERTTNAMLECLGPHVNHVSIDDQYTWSILQQLVHNKCTNIKILEINHHCNYHSLPLKNHEAFSSIMGIFSRTLTQLFIDFHPCSVSLTMLLDILPGLTHLSIKLSRHCQFDDFETQYTDKAHDKKSSKSNIVFLCLDSAFDFNTRIEPVLQRCPLLKYFLVSNFYSKRFVTSIPTCQLQTVLTLCPSTRYILWNTLIDQKKIEKEWISLSTKDHSIMDNNFSLSRGDIFKQNDDNGNSYREENDGTLQELAFSGENELWKLIPILTRSQNTLQRLHFSYMYAHQIKGVMRNLYFSRLKSLDLTSWRGNIMDEIDWLGCNLFGMHQQQLNHLMMDIDMDNITSDGEGRPIDCLNKTIEVVSNNLKKLEHLYLWSTYDINDDMCCSKLYLFSKNNSKLRRIGLSGIPISNDGLLELSKLSKLQTLILSEHSLFKHLTEDGFIAFSRRLKEQNTIQDLHLYCGHTNMVTNTVLEHLACVGSLETLHIGCNSVITDTGANIFGKSNIDCIKVKSSRNYNRNKKLLLYACCAVSKENPYVSFLNYFQFYFVL